MKDARAVRYSRRDLLTRALALPAAVVAAARAVADEAPGWPLSIRLSSYGKFEEAGWSHLGTLGVRHVYLPVPAPAEVVALHRRLTAHGLSPLVLGGRADLGHDGWEDALTTQFAVCEALGVRYVFLSPRHTGIDRAEACRRLVRAGDLARRHRLTIALETHPDLGLNAAAHLDTMRRVDHPNVRVNFDTGNISYYNAGANAVAELEKVVAHVATVELKDHDLVPQSWNFPALGRGKVDFPGVLRVLKDHGFRGPVTVEVEGIRGTTWNEDETKRMMAESVGYLRRIGTFR